MRPVVSQGWLGWGQGSAWSLGTCLAQSCASGHWDMWLVVMPEGGWDGDRPPPGLGGPSSCPAPLLRPRRLVLPDPDVSPLLSRGSGAEAEADDCSSGEPHRALPAPQPSSEDEGAGLSSPLLPAADDNPTVLLDPEKSPALLEEPLSSEVEEGDEELPTAPLPAKGDEEVAETLPAERPGPPTWLLLPPGPVGAEGLAEAALEDGECWGASKRDTHTTPIVCSPRTTIWAGKAL